MLALAPGIGYIHEPFSPVTSAGISGAPFDHFYTRVTPENEALYLPHLERTLRFEYGYRRQLRTLRSPSEAVRSAQDAIAFARARHSDARPLVKDPIALMSAEWLAERFEMDVVVTIRHPAAFAASVLRLGWTHPFETFLDDERLSAFEPEIRRQATAPGDPLDQAALLWRILYSTVDGYRSRHADWVFVRHEDASRAPLDDVRAPLRAARARADLARTARDRAPQRAREPGAAPLAPRGPSRQRRRRRELAHLLRRPTRRRRLREATRDVWPRFYADDDW